MHNAIVLHPVGDIPEVAPHESETGIVNDVLFGIGILIEAVQMTVLT
jgi:hypothetical protein